MNGGQVGEEEGEARLNQEKPMNRRTRQQPNQARKHHQENKEAIPEHPSPRAALQATLKKESPREGPRPPTSLIEQMQQTSKTGK